MLLDPENTLFVRGTATGPPVLLLSQAPVHDALPAFPPVTAQDGSVPVCEGWGIAPKLTVCVVDGPGEAGLMIPALMAPVLGENGEGGEKDDVPGVAMSAWRADAERAGGAVVLSLDRLPEVIDWYRLLGADTTRGGFVRLLG